MPPRKRKATAPAKSTDESEAFVPEMKVAKKLRKEESVHEPQTTENDEHCDGVQKPRAPLTWAEFEQEFKGKSAQDMKAYLQSFDEKLSTTDEEIRNAFKESRTVLTSTGNKQAKSVAEVCQRIAAEEQRGPMNRDNHALSKAGQQIFTTCHNILDRHEKTAEASVSHKISLPGDKWKADNAFIQEILSFGRQYGEKLVDCVITLDSDLEVMKVNRDKLPETGNMAIDIYKKSSQAVGGQTWARTAEAQLNAISGLVKIFAK